MKVSREPQFDLLMVLDGAEECAAGGVGTMVQPSTAIGDVHVLQHPQSAPHDGGMRTDQHLPPVLGRVFLQRLEEPARVRERERRKTIQNEYKEHCSALQSTGTHAYHSIWASSMWTSCDEKGADRNRTVDKPIRMVRSPIFR